MQMKRPEPSLGRPPGYPTGYENGSHDLGCQALLTEDQADTDQKRSGDLDILFIPSITALSGQTSRAR
jgi:hypothetical protein